MKHLRALRHPYAGCVLAASVVGALAFCGSAAGAAGAGLQLEPEARLHLDYGRHDADQRPLDDGGSVRRATVGLKARFNADLSFELAYELSSDGRLRPRDGKFKDVALSYRGGPAGVWTLGQFKLPFGLEELTSSNDTLFVERALPVDAFAPSRRLGVGWGRGHEAYTVAAMVFGSALDDGDRGRGVAARVTTASIRSAGRVLHLGLAAALEKPRGKVDFDAAPESRVADVELVNTGGIDAVRRIARVGVEAAWRTGPFSVQAEWMQVHLRRDGQPRARLDGWTLAGAWVLTGESRPYKGGRFRGIEPTRRAGAWELTARLSAIDLDHGNVRGGRERNLTLGLNYTFNQHLRVMLNHVGVHSQRRGHTDDPGLWVLRVQFVL